MKRLRNIRNIAAQSSNVAKRGAAIASKLALSSVTAFASTGTLAVTQGLTKLSTEFSGPLAYGVATAGLAICAADFFRHKEIGAIGWAGVGLAGAAGFMMSAPSLLTLFGVAAMVA